MPVIHMRGATLSEIAASTGGFFFVWTLWALGALGGVTMILSVRGLWSLRRGGGSPNGVAADGGATDPFLSLVAQWGSPKNTSTENARRAYGGTDDKFDIVACFYEWARYSLEPSDIGMEASRLL
jgi:hypothetical protein